MRAWVLAIVWVVIAGCASEGSARAVVTRPDQILWREQAPGSAAQIATLWGDRATGAAGVLIRTPGGFHAGVHAHTSDYQGIVVAGTWAHSVGAIEERLPLGSHWFQPARELHDDRCVSEEACIVLILSSAPFARIAADSPAALATLRTPQEIEAAVDRLQGATWIRQSPDAPGDLFALWGDRAAGGYGELVRMAAGFDSGLHAHTGDYHGVLISGVWEHVEADGHGEGQELLPGAYVMQPGMGMHIDRCKSSEGCIFFIQQDVRADMVWPRR